MIRISRASVARNLETNIKVRELQATDPLMDVTLMEDQNHISQETICQILHEYFKKTRSIRSLFHTGSRISNRRTEPQIVQTFIQTCKANLHFLSCIMTGDTSWVYRQNRETKFQSIEWKIKSPCRPKNVGQHNSRIEIILRTFLKTGCD